MIIQNDRSFLNIFYMIGWIVAEAVTDRPPSACAVPADTAALAALDSSVSGRYSRSSEIRDIAVALTTPSAASVRP